MEIIATLFFQVREWKDFFEKNDNIHSIEKMLLNTKEILLPNVCGCQLKNDTIIISGGVFYGGGIGYEIKIHKNRFDGKIILASNSKNHKKEKEDEFVDELHLKSKKQKLYLTKKPIYELDKIIKGKVVMEFQDFFTKNENILTKDKYWMKIVFECKLSKQTPF